MKKIICGILAAGLIFSMTGCKGKKNAGKNGKMVEADAAFAVNTYNVVAGSLDDYLEFGGDIVAINAVDVMPDMAGKISRVLVSIGDKVTKNQVIAEVDASRAGMTYSASPVKAPMAGRITSLISTVGTSVSQSTSIAKISSTDDVEIKTSISERFVSRIRNGQNAEITFDAYPGEKFKAKVYEVSPVLDTVSRTMPAKLRFVTKDSRIKIGMYARVHLVTDTVKNAIILPHTAVVTRNEKKYVFLVEGTGNQKTARQVSVEAGLRVDDKIEIRSGLKAGDEVITSGQNLLNDGAKINVISSK